MICPYCKSELPDGLQFCSKCGQTIAHQDNQNSASSTYWSAVEKEVARDDKIRIDAENKIIAKQKKKNRSSQNIFQKAFWRTEKIFIKPGGQT